MQRRHCPATTPSVTITDATDIAAAGTAATGTAASLLPSGEKGIDETKWALLPVALEGGLIKVARSRTYDDALRAPLDLIIYMGGESR